MRPLRLYLRLWWGVKGQHVRSDAVAGQTRNREQAQGWNLLTQSFIKAPNIKDKSVSILAVAMTTVV